ncbi:MAG: hypothetical protein IKJ05_02050 [Oscillospiraceae bacterium]|nr:hypothetical protein [Oscillospiraceae bacterium]
MKKKSIALLMAVVMLFGVAVGGTIAWLKATTDPVVNTFVHGDINIELDEAPLKEGSYTEIDTNAKRVKSEDGYKMVPGNTMEKDPQVRVLADSEDSWLFIKIEESENFDDYLTYAIAEGWKTYQAETNHVTILYRENVKAGDKFYILAENKVSVKEDVTKEMMNAIDGKVDETDKTADEIKAAQDAELALRPTLKFTAYAVQAANVTTVADAWSIATTGAKPANP